MYGTISANLLPHGRGGGGWDFGIGTTIASSIGPFLRMGLIIQFAFTGAVLIAALLLLLAAGFTLLIAE